MGTPAQVEIARAVGFGTALLFAIVLAAGCGTTSGVPPPEPVPAQPAVVRPDLIVLAVGDINLGRVVGRRILAGRIDEPFEQVRGEVSRAGIAFANLESQLSDQNGRTEGASNYVFTGPPQGADALARAGFDVVSTANNHAWDYGERGMRETLENLRRVGIAPAGTGATLEEAYRPAVLERDGWRVAFIAVTGIFNTPFERSPAREHVAWADLARVAPAIAEARRAGADLVFVSYHGGVEYQPRPTKRTRDFARACIDAGADALIGHHPHVTQGIEWYRGRPIFYSLGNFLFKQFDPWTDRGMAVRMTARDGDGLEVEYLPVAVGLQPRFLDVGGEPLLARVANLSGGELAPRAPS
jgi:poly-gamma-glutamate capsule biosynthesis protein CapA/YwtB (metallophosphatase superfamily)